VWITAVPVEFILFGATLLGIAIFHRHTLAVALAGLALIVVHYLRCACVRGQSGLAGLWSHLQSEWVLLANLLLLLTGFALLARHFEQSRAPLALPAILPQGWKGGFALLAVVFVLSAFLDNIAAALIGGALAHHLFRGRVHLGYVAAIVAAANAGGAGSVIGDTTTTMMWISGVRPREVLHAYVAAVVALVVCGVPASLRQQRHSPLPRTEHERVRVDTLRIGIVVAVLAVVFAVNVLINWRHSHWSARFPFLGMSVWLVLLVAAPLRRPDWTVLPGAFKGSLFLLALVLAATFMPVGALPAASWQTALGLGFVSAVFDNIPLTTLALRQGGYDWGVLAYAVGFGGSMLWFGSSAGVALVNQFPEGKSVWAWLRQGWHVILAYVAGFAAVMAVLGWHPR